MQLVQYIVIVVCLSAYSHLKQLKLILIKFNVDGLLKNCEL